MTYRTSVSDYKKTPLGLLPKEWKVEKLGKYIKIYSGQSPSKVKFKKDGIPYYKVDDLNNFNKFMGNSVLKIDSESVKKKVPKNSLIFPKRGAAILSNKVRILVQESYFDTNIMGIEVNEKEIDFEYLYYFIVMRGLYKIADTSTIPQLNNKHIEPLKIPRPPLKEQKKIALILSTWDKAIELKEKLIEQKKELKKGLMQKLLTGEVRLPGFEGKWKKVKLKEISVCLDNLRRPINSKEREKMKGNIPYYGANGIVDYVNDYLFDEPLILMAEDGGHFNEFRDRPIAMKIEGKAWVNNHAHVLRIINSDYDFVYYSLVHKDIRKYINGSTRGKLTQSDMLAIELILPDSIEEQKAISHILMKIDLNIELLERELKELKCQKKGLMQLLLTGKVRVKV